MLEGVEDQLAIRADPLVLENQRDVELAAGQPETCRFLPRVELVEDEEEATIPSPTVRATFTLKVGPRTKGQVLRVESRCG